MSDTDLAFRATLDGSGFASGAQRINGQLQQMGFQTQTATAGLGGIGTMLGTMANPATAAALGITAIGGALASSVGVAANFESAMSRVASVAGASQADLERMSTAAREAGASSVFSASQAADAMYFLASSGMTVDQQITSLGSTLDLASAGGLELARSAEVMTSSLSQFGLGADQADRVANLFAATSAAANTDVEQLGQAMKEAGPMAASLGISIEQTSAAIASLSNAGIKGSQAGTALKSMLGSMVQETKTGTAALAEMGLTYENINPAANSYADIMGTLAEKNMTASQAVAIFGKEQASAALAAVNGAKDLETLEEKITGTSKATEMSAQMTDNYNGAMEELGGAIEEAQITLGNAFLPSLTSGVKFLTNMTNAATDTAKAIGDLAGAWNDWVASSVSDSAELERQYEETNKGHWEMIAGDAIWIGDEFGKAIAEEVANSDELAKAPGDALGSDETLKGAGDAGAAVAEEFSKEWVEAFQKEQGTRDIAKILARAGNDALTKNKGNVAGWASTTLKNGLNIDIAYQGRGNELMSRLFIDGQQIGGPVYGTREEGIRELLKKWQYDQGNVYELMDEPGNAAVWRSSQHVVNIADLIFAPETAIKSKIKELTDAAKAAFEDGIMTMGKDSEQLNLLGLAQDLDMLHARFPQEFEKIGGEAIKELEDALKRNDIVKAMSILGEIAGEEFKKNLVGGAKIEMPSLLEMVEDPKLILETFESIPKFQENYLIPRLTENMDEVKELMTSGVKEQEIIDAYIKPLEAVYDYMPEKLQDIYKQVTNGQMSLESFVDQYYDGFTEKADEKASEAAEAFKSTNAMFYNEILDDSEHWSNYINSEGGFIGPTAKWYEMKIDEQAELNNIAALKQIYEGMGGESPAMVGSIATKLDTTEAYNDLEAIKADIVSANPTAMLELDTSVADSRFQNFYKLVEESRPTMYFDAVPVVDMGALVSAIAAALRAEGV